MREAIKDWKNNWIETNGITDEIELLIIDSWQGELSPYVYEGSFAKIPKEFLEKKVIECGRVVDSSITERIGAYTLTI